MRKHVVFSAVKGQVLLKNSPVADLELLQRWSWFGVDDGEARTKTDAEGRFSFPVVHARKFFAGDDIMVSQNLTVRYGNEMLHLWTHTRTSLGENGELGGHSIVLTAHLDQPEITSRVAIAPNAMASIDGVSTISHPYLEKLAQAEAALSEEKLSSALKHFLSTPEAMAKLKIPFAAIPGGVELRAVDAISKVEFTDAALYTAPAPDRFAHNGEVKYVGAKLRAEVALSFQDGSVVNATFFTWSAFLPVSPDGRPSYEMQVDPEWEVTAREALKKQVNDKLVAAQLAALVDRMLNKRPPDARAEMLGFPGERNVSFKNLRIDSFEVLSVYDGKAPISFKGGISIKRAAEETEQACTGSILLGTRSLAQEEYTFAGGKDSDFNFSAVGFRIVMATDKSKYSRSEKITLSFTVENLLNRKARYLPWHTPFEGFRNDFLLVKNIDTDQEIQYSGIMASRVGPQDDDYLQFEPNSSKSSTIEITQAYHITEPGRYSLSFKPLAMNVMSNQIEFVVR